MGHKDTYEITTNLNDGKSEAPPLVFQTADIDELGSVVVEEIQGDSRNTIPVGGTVLIERVA